jgi:hypothetical protein
MRRICEDERKAILRLPIRHSPKTALKNTKFNAPKNILDIGYSRYRRFLIFYLPASTCMSHFYLCVTRLPVLTEGYKYGYILAPPSLKGPFYKACPRSSVVEFSFHTRKVACSTPAASSQFLSRVRFRIPIQPCFIQVSYELQ